MQHLIAPILFLCTLVAHPPLPALGLAFHSLLGRERTDVLFKLPNTFIPASLDIFAIFPSQACL